MLGRLLDPAAPAACTVCNADARWAYCCSAMLLSNAELTTTCIRCFLVSLLQEIMALIRELR